MSLPEPSLDSQPLLTATCAPKPRPPVPRKPARSVSRYSGKVKRIVNKFSQQDSVEGERSAKGTEPYRVLKRGPTVKPKRVTLAGTCLAPLLPARGGAILRKSVNKEEEERAEGEKGADGPVGEEGGRSAPDGREVDIVVVSRAMAEVEHGSEVPLGPHCEQDCGCVCHLERPGMRLVWVPVEEEEDEEEEEDGESRGEGESEVEEQPLDEDDERDQSGSSGESEEEHTLGIGAQRKKFQHVLDLMTEDGNKKRTSDIPLMSKSDPGSKVTLISFTQPLIQLPSIPPDSAVDDSIYEDTLNLISAPRTKASPDPGTKQTPALHQPKPPRRSKFSLSSSDMTSDPQSELDSSQLSNTEVDSPPAIPPRIPLTRDRGKSPRPQSIPWGTPSQQPSTEERVSRGSSPPLLTPSYNRLLPPSPHLPCRPPQQASPEAKRHSITSVQSISHSSDKEEETRSIYEDTEAEDMLPEARPLNTNMDLRSRLLNEPLYQTYRATVITKEIKRQTVCRNISKTSVDYQMDWESRRGEVRGGGPVQSTLWQDLPSVRESGIIEKLNPTQIKYQESMFEMITSEASYLRSLRVLTDHFLDSRDLDETLIVHDKKTLFSNILRVREVSERFLNDLEERMGENLVISDICDIVHYHSQHNFPAYVDYVRNQLYQDKTYCTLMQKNKQFAAVITRLQESPHCQRLPFSSFLLLPFQRITRIKMLIENILKRTQEGTKEEQTASKALCSVSKIIDDCNTEVGKMKRMEELIHIAKKLEFEKLKAIPIISPTRYLEKQGDLQEIAKGGTLFNIRPKFTSVYLFLFNDLLLLTNKKSSDRYVVIDHAHRSLVQVRALPEDSSVSGLDNCLCLTLLENHQSRTNERLLRAPTQSDMKRWISAFPDPDNPEKDTDEVVYEDWDCPQVQCIEQYVSQQTDELNLEPTEIINVVRKTNEGWYEGIKLSDRQKGWFPERCVLEITNEHVRRRNLRERYRVIQAAHATTKSWTGS